MGFGQVVDPDVEVDLLLLRPVRPPRGDVVGCELEAEPPLAVDDDAVPVVTAYTASGTSRLPYVAFARSIAVT